MLKTTDLIIKMKKMRRNPLPYIALFDRPVEDKDHLVIVCKHLPLEEVFWGEAL